NLPPVHSQYSLPLPILLHSPPPFTAQPNPPCVPPRPYHKVMLHLPLPPVVHQVNSPIYLPVAHLRIRPHLRVPSLGILPHKIIAPPWQLLLPHDPGTLFSPF